MTDHDFHGECEGWALGAALACSNASGDLARALSSGERLGVRKSHLENAQRSLREAQDSITRSLINLDLARTEEEKKKNRPSAPKADVGGEA